MSRKAKHNARIHARIRLAAGRAFRDHGFHKCQIDTIMTAAGLTRGAFYAHFPSKAALFADVVGQDHMLLNWLKSRSTASPDALKLGLQRIFSDYVSPNNHDAILRGCSLAALHRDVALGDDLTRQAFDAAYSATIAEMQRGMSGAPSDNQAHSVLSQAIGAVSLAAGCSDAAAKRSILTAAGRTVRALLDVSSVSMTADR